ncbi:Gfo/Idh/MocA family oxidoreductase [Actinoplanes siamensis]|uniref:hypothetical protein n=1 Tax=Actinoplanes siamensis TaxID=1223317 RepID=UPI001940A574|nr:hypothetical protein [Actinoplanes siamensis]
MSGSLIVGLGRSGAGLHLPALRRLPPELRDPMRPVLGWDPAVGSRAETAGVTVVASPAEAATRLDPATTVTHVCMPPRGRATVLAALAACGFRRFVIEKPLAVDEAGLEALLRIVGAHRLQVVPMSQWLSSTLTSRIEKIISSGMLGRLISLTFRQRRPRFDRGLRDKQHPTAFDVEIPHSLGAALRLAGGGQVCDAAWGDLRAGGVVVPRLGSAWLTVAHRGGVRTRIDSDLTSPVRERRVHARFTGGTLTGWYPGSEADHHAQLVVDDGRRRGHAVFLDDALGACVADAYRYFATAGGQESATVTDRLAVNADVVRLLADAKRCAARRNPGS